MDKTVVKRDGRKVDFNSERIISAILKAMSKTEKGIDEELAHRIADSIYKIEKKKLGVEEIQDLVQHKLMTSSRKDVAIEFITYRNDRSKTRQRNNELNKKIKKILMCENVENSNANVDEYSFGGRKFESAGALHKDFALNNLIREEVVDAFKDNRIYIHDLDSYDVGMHNCLQVDMQRLLNNGFKTRNGDVRAANSINTAMQLVAVIFQCQSQVQYGGVGSVHLDFDLAPFVDKSFKKHFYNGLYYLNYVKEPNEYVDIYIDKDNITLSNINNLSANYKRAIEYALRELDKEGLQSAQALFHNLNTLESRPGSQLPFTSVNFGRDTSPEGRKVSEWLLKASIDGIGKYNMTSIFPISIYQYKKGINDKKGTPNYDLKKLAIKSLCKRIYPNFVNGDYSQNKEDPNNPDTYNATMGCVDGQEIITYKISDVLYVESFERMWNRLSQLFEVKEQEVKGNYYIDLENVSIFDTKRRFVKALKIIKNKDKGDWTRIKFTNGRSLLATSDHPLPIINKGRVFVKDIEIGDKIFINQQQYNENTINYNIEKAWMLGVLLCDGCYDSNITVSINAEGEDEIEAAYKRTFEKEYSLKVNTKLQTRGKKGNYKDLITEGQQSHIKRELENLFGGLQKKNRQIPNQVFAWSREAKLSFLAGMIDADGYINNKGNGGSTVQIGSTNKELALQTMALAQSLGLPSKVYLNHYTSTDKNKLRYRIEFSATLELLNYIVCNKKIDCFEREANITKVNVSSVMDFEQLGYLEKCSYDVTTESDYFEVSGIYSHNCRTTIGYDRFTGTYNKVGRGNVSPVTINLPKIGIKHGICLNERNKADLDGFWKELDEVLELTATALVDRFYHMCSQSVKSAPFMYANGTITDFEKANENGIYEAMRHNTQSIGYIGIAEMCQALFGKNHAEDNEVREFALSVVKRIYDFVNESSEKYNLNFSTYATPAENLCRTMMSKLKEEFGEIKNVTDREYLTNSHHVPVWQKVTVYEKLQIEAPFCKYPTGGCITYVELESSVVQNEEAVEQIIDFAMDLDIPYLAINFPIDTCLDCGYQSEINDKCPVDNSDNIQRLRRVTGYLTTDYRNFNDGKIAETLDRVKHNVEGESN